MSQNNHPTQGFSRLRPSQSGTATTTTILAGKPPSKVSSKANNPALKNKAIGNQSNRFGERHSSNPNMMKGVDFIEETKDYQKVIHDLKDLLENPR